MSGRDGFDVEELLDRGGVGVGARGEREGRRRPGHAEPDRGQEGVCCFAQLLHGDGYQALNFIAMFKS